MEKNVLEYLEKSAVNYPDKVCVDDGEKELTYRELQVMAKVAGEYVAAKSDAGKPVVILSKKSSDVLALMMGVVYAGCHYVMIDPSQPADRLRGFLQVLDAKLVLTHQANMALLEVAGYKNEICMISDAFLAYHSQDMWTDSALLCGRREGSRDSDILYCLFTSGSTGTPKAIAVSHRCVLDFIGHFSKEFGFSSDDIIGNQAPFDFDVSVKDIYTTFQMGAKMILIPMEYFSTPAILLDLLCEKEVTSLTWAVSALTMISALKGFKYRIPDKIKRVMFSGEVMPAKQLKIWQEAVSDANYVNLYGPTEITCNCTFFKIPGKWNEEEMGKLPIGKAFGGRRVFLLDEGDALIEQPMTTGEICVTGESVALGYVNNPEETTKHFINYPLDGQDMYCYRTGDLGYFDENGLFYFAGRKDFQIKHMGHRIELEEIENAIGKVDGVDRCCCFMDEKRKRLIGFYMGTTTSENVKEALKQKLPAYMVPHSLKCLESLPLTKNGKTDRNQLKSMFDQKMI